MSSECITTFTKKVFTTSAVVSAQKAQWDKKTGQVKSDDMDEIDKELQQVTNSWVDVSLLSASREVVQESAALKSGDMAAFIWEEGASIKTIWAAVGAKQILGVILRAVSFIRMKKATVTKKRRQPASRRTAAGG